MKNQRKVFEYMIFKRRETRGKIWYQGWDGPHARSATARRIKNKLYSGDEYIIARLCVDIQARP